MERVLVLALAVLALLLVLTGVILWAVSRLRRRARELSRSLLGASSLVGAAEKWDGLLEAEDAPRSLNACDSIYLPQLREDFPDFNLDHARELAGEYLAGWLRQKGRGEVEIHRTVISGYRRYGAEKELVFQSAAAYRAPDAPRRTQGRFELIYSYRLSGGEGKAAQVPQCPQCGGVLPEDGASRCRFCGSVLVHLLEATWCFTGCREL
jgi:hypothetical protein